MVAGQGRLVELIRDFRFTGAEHRLPAEPQIVDDATADWLAAYRFTGDIDGYAEGELFFPGSPILTVSGTFAECVVLETLILSVLNHDCAIAAAAARMVTAARGRPIIEMGSRRTHEDAAVAAARAAYLAGFASTSNLAAGARYGIPTTGTSAHAFTLLHDDEPAAFASQVAALGKNTTLLVDTYDIAQGIRNAIAVAGPGLRAIRIDSGDLSVLAQHSRELLDSLGATDTKIIVSGDMDEYAIAALAAEPVDMYGAGTAVVTGSGAPTAGPGLQAGRGRGPAGGQTLGEQGDGRRPQDRRTPAQADRHRDRGDHRLPGRARPRAPTTGCCSARSSPAASRRRRRRCRSPATTCGSA